MTTATLERPKTRQQQQPQPQPKTNPAELNPAPLLARISETDKVVAALIHLINKANSQQLNALMIELEAMPLDRELSQLSISQWFESDEAEFQLLLSGLGDITGLHHMAMLRVRDAWRARLSEFYPPL